MKFKKRPTKRLAEIIESDLLTATEKLIKNEIGGFYCITDEAAYFKTSSDKSVMSISEFEKHLRKTVDPNFFIVYNPVILPDHLVQGHQIGLYVDAYKGFVPICKVGRNAEKFIPANSQGKLAAYKGKTFEKSKGAFTDEEPLLYRGWVAAEEACKRLIEDISKFGISPMRCITPREFLAYKKTVEKIDGERLLHEVFKDAASQVNAQLRLEQAEVEKKAEDYLLEVTKKGVIDGAV